MPFGGNGGRRFGGGNGTRAGFGGYLPDQPGALAAAAENEREQQPKVEPPTFSGNRAFDRTDRSEAQGYQDQVEMPRFRQG